MFISRTQTKRVFFFRQLEWAKLVYLPKIGGLDLKNNNLFKLTHFQPNPFNPRVKRANPHNSHIFFNYFFRERDINLGYKKYDLVIKYNTSSLFFNKK